MNAMIMVCHSLKNNTRTGLVIFLCLTLIWTGGGGGQICPPSWFFEHSSETVRSRKLKLSEFDFLFIRHLFK